MFPADQRFQTDYTAILDGNLGLIIQRKLILLDRLRHLAHQREPARAVLIQAGIVQGISAVLVLGDVHRHVGVPYYDVGIQTMLRIQGDTDAGVDPHREFLDELEWFAYLFQQVCSLCYSDLRISDRGHEQGEFISTEAGEHIICLRQTLQAQTNLS